MEQFLEDLSSSDPVPGGGSVAALQTAMGASLLAMVANLTVGRKRYQEVQDQVSAIREQALQLRQQAQNLIDEDIEAYRVVSTALSLPRETEEEKTKRQQQVQEALKGAVSPPLTTMRLASRVTQLASDLVSIGNKSAVSDVGTAALAARAGYHSACLNVEINLASIKDLEWIQGIRSELEGIPSPDRLEQATRDRVLSVIRGEQA